MRLTITNYRRVASARIDIAPVALVCGRNEAGKTSIAQAARAALMREGAPHPGAMKKDGALMVHRGEKEGIVVLATEAGGTTTVAFPKGAVAAPDEPAPPFATALAAGTQHLSAMTIEDRTKALARYVDAVPNLTDLTKAMQAIDYGQEAAVSATWNAIQEKGWDKTADMAAAHATKAKAAWSAATGGEVWGAKKAAGWRPDGWSDDMAADAATIEAAVKDAEAKVERLIGARAVAKAASPVVVTEAQRALAATVPALERAEAAAKAKAGEAFEAMREASILARPTVPATLTCPHCGSDVMLTGDGTLSPDAPTPADIEAAREAQVKHDARLEGARAEHKRRHDVEQKARADLIEARAALRAVEAADMEADAAATADAPPAVSDEDVDAARRELAAARDRAAKVKAVVEASRQHIIVTRSLALADLLGPEGLRKRKLAAALESFSAELAGLSKAAGWRPVRIDAALNLFLGDDPYWLCSESAKFRIDATLQVAFARQDGSDLVVIDGADVLDVSGRNGLFGMLAAAGVRALVTMTINKPALVPDLRKAGMGDSYWLSDGAAAPLAQQLEQKVA